MMYLVPYATIWCVMMQYDTTKCHFSWYVATSRNMMQFGAVWCSIMHMLRCCRASSSQHSRSLRWFISSNIWQLHDIWVSVKTFSVWYLKPQMVFLFCNVTFLWKSFEAYTFSKEKNHLRCFIYSEVNI